MECFIAYQNATDARYAPDRRWMPVQAITCSLSEHDV